MTSTTTVMINAKKILLRPNLHFNQVHKEVEARQGKSKAIIRGKKNFLQTTLLPVKQLSAKNGQLTADTTTQNSEEADAIVEIGVNPTNSLSTPLKNCEKVHVKLIYGKN